MGKIFKIILMFISIIAGALTAIYPEKISLLTIRIVGVIWVLEGIFKFLELRLSYLRYKAKIK